MRRTAPGFFRPAAERPPGLTPGQHPPVPPVKRRSRPTLRKYDKKFFRFNPFVTSFVSFVHKSFVSYFLQEQLFHFILSSFLAKRPERLSRRSGRFAFFLPFRPHISEKNRLPPRPLLPICSYATIALLSEALGRTWQNFAPLLYCKLRRNLHCGTIAAL